MYIGGVNASHPLESMYAIIHIERLTTQPLQKEASCHSRVGYFRHLFILFCFHPYIFLFNTSIASVGTHERIAKIRASKCPILEFLWDFGNRQHWI